jgi:hypothetical protein
MIDAKTDGVLILGEFTTPTTRAENLPRTVTQVLGLVEVPGFDVVGKPAANSTRWILDVESTSGMDIKLFLLDFRNGRRVSPDLMSYTITPLDADCYDARPFAIEGPGSLQIRTRRLQEGVVIHYRVQIDVMHSATR